MSAITFGTDGWRAVIADEFTFDNVRRVTAAIAATVQRLELPPDVRRNAVAVGYDRRFLSRRFAHEVALELSRAGLRVQLSDTHVPSPAVSFVVRERKLAGGIVVTASHNPAEYNGIKFKGWYGGSALPEMYAAIAKNLGEEKHAGGGGIEEMDFLGDYVDALSARIDGETLDRANTRILHDAMYGVSAGLPERVVELAGPSTISTFRGEANPGFGGINPEPIPENLRATVALMQRGEFDLAICNDGDSDRLGILDEKGEFVSPHKILSLLTLYLSRERKAEGSVVKTFSTTRLIEHVARELGLHLHETAIGFKYVADIMLREAVMIGGEESGGIGFGWFLPERDGVLSGLLVAECVARRRRPLSVIIDEMEEEFGALHFDRADIRHAPPLIDGIMARAERGDLDRTFGADFDRRESVDGIKLNYADGTWVLLRRSGTEPMVRFYCESPDRGRVGEILEQCRQLA